MKKAAPIRQFIKLPSMTPGTHSEIGVLRYGKAGQGPKAYIQAAVHANELPGAMLMHHLMPMLNEAQYKGLILGEMFSSDGESDRACTARWESAPWTL